MAGVIDGAGLRGTVLPPASVRARARLRDGVRPARPSALVRAGWFPWLPVWLACGIGLWFALPFQPGVRGHALAAVVVCLGLYLWWRVPLLAGAGRIGWGLADGLRLGGLALAVAGAGFMLAGLRSAEVAGPVIGWRYYGPVEGRLIEVDRSARDRIRLTLDQVVLHDMAPSRTPRQVRLSLPDGAGADIPPPGTRVMTTGHLGPPPGPAAPGSFDFRRQAWFEGLGAIGYTRNPVMVSQPPDGQGGMWLGRLRQRMSQGMQRAIGGQEGAVASALMTGDRSGIAEATNAVMRDANLYHIVSISGLHMSMLAGFIYAALRIALAAGAAATGRGIGWPFHKLAAAVALAAAAFYLVLSDGGVATERAFVMIAVMLGAILVDRRAISLRTVSLAGLILLVLAPEALTQPGFQMSFAATVALILSSGPWSRVSPHVPRLLRPVAMLLLSSAVAGMSTTPLAAAHFNRMSEYGLLANLLAVPLMGAVVMPAGVIAALLTPIGLAQPALWVMGVGTGLMLDIARFIAGLHGAVSAVPSPPGAVIPLLGLGGVLLALGGGGLGLPRGLVRGTGVAALALALGLWLTSARPVLLIAPEGDAAGLMTSYGRATSKPKGGSFAVSTWLAEDGDTATPEAAGARPGWSGPANARSAVLPGGRRVVHLTGKGAAAALPAACRDGALVIAAVDDRHVPARQGKREGTAKARRADKLVQGQGVDLAKPSTTPRARRGTANDGAGASGARTGGKDDGSAVAGGNGTAVTGANSAGSHADQHKDSGSEDRSKSSQRVGVGRRAEQVPQRIGGLSASGANATQDPPRKGASNVSLSADSSHPRSAQRDCQLIDLASLRRTGAVAVWADGTITTVSQTVGTRPWIPGARGPKSTQRQSKPIGKGPVPVASGKPAKAYAQDDPQEGEQM